MHLKAYHPYPRFPALSLSGGACELRCQHCDAAYLRRMIPAQTPAALLATARRLQAMGAIGALLSGGSDRHGRLLNLPTLRDAIREARAETGLLFNLHPGLLDAETARALAVDIVSLELPGAAVINDVFGLATDAGAYWDTYRHLAEAGLNVTPHVTVYDGSEIRLLEALARRVAAGALPAPAVFVIIAFAPTPGTPLAGAAPPSPEAWAGVIRNAHAAFPIAEISLGCMRPRAQGLRQELELAALEAGVARMELPSRATLQYLTTQGYTVQTFNACCALPVAYEPRAIAAS